VKSLKSLFICKICVLFLLFASGFLLVSCVAPEKKSGEVNYINNHGYGANISALLSQASKSIYRIELNVMFKIGKTKGQTGGTGIAFAVDKHHLFTADHLTHIDTITIDTPIGPLSGPLRDEDITKQWMAIVRDDGSKWPVRVIYQDKENDFAVLESRNALVDPIYTIGNSDKLNLLDTIMILTDFGTGMRVSVGHIAQRSITRYERTGKLESNRSNIFGFSAIIAPGDSGSPIFVMKNGRLEVGGITSFMINPISGLGYGTKITSAVELLYVHNDHTPWVHPLLHKEILSSKSEKIFYNIDRENDDY